MYSVVLMMAMSGGADAVDFGRRGGCNGGGCHGGGYSCSGGGYGCSGGYGGGYGCSGGFGGCSGVSYGGHGCSGGGHGCNGRGGLFSRGHGGRGHGCNGGGYGCSGGYACSGFGGGYACSGFGGGVGCAGGVIIGGGGCYGGHGGHYMPPADGGKKDMPKEPPAKGSLEAPATILVSLPANSNLSIDGARTTSTGTERRFVSPALEIGREYSYTLTAEINQNGETTRQSRTITVRGGQETRVSFTQAVTTAGR